MAWNFGLIYITLFFIVVFKINNKENYKLFIFYCRMESIPFKANHWRATQANTGEQCKGQLTIYRSSR